VTPVVQDLLVDFIGDQGEVVVLAQIRDPAERLLWEDGARRIRGAVHDHRLRAGRDRLPEGVGRENEAVLVRGLNGHGASAREAHHRVVAHPSGIGHQDLVPWFDEGHDREEEAVLRRGDEDVVVLRGDSVLPSRLLRNRLPEFAEAHRAHVLRHPNLGHRLLASLDDVCGCREVGLPDAEVDDVLALRPEFVREDPEADGRGGADRFNAGRDGLHSLKVFVASSKG
jgi:hypothetical protein